MVIPLNEHAPVQQFDYPPARPVRVAGLPAVRQRPPTAKGILFLSLEDETGLVDLVVRPDVVERYRQVLRGTAMLLVEGVVQSASGALSVLVTRISRPFQ